jgi:hypothetical protein
MNERVGDRLRKVVGRTGMMRGMQDRWDGSETGTIGFNGG